MKVRELRIKNYRSIKDTGAWELEDRIEALAGKNASGKSSIFEALQLLNRSLRIHLLMYGPIEVQKEQTEIQISLEIPLEELDGRARELVRHACSDDAIKNEVARVKITKRIMMDGKIIYKINQKTMQYLANKDLVELSALLNETPKVKQLIPAEMISIESNGEKGKAMTNLGFRQFVSCLRDFEDGMEIEQMERAKIDRMVELGEMLANFRYPHVIQEIIPRFELFEYSKKDMIPDEIMYDQVPGHKVIRRMLSAMGINANELVQLSKQPGSFSIIKKIFERRNEDLEQFIHAAWMQSKILLHIIPGKQGLKFTVIEREKVFKISQRSGGEIWFIAFVSFFYDMITKRKPTVILIDEPSNNLHPDAQKDILWMMEALVGKYGHLTLLYCSHSPYMFDPEKLYRIARVIRTEKLGTVIEKRPVLASSAMESITPIMTAIGDNLAAGIRPDRRNNVITEGYTDYIYLITIKEVMAGELPLPDPLYIIPSLGAGKMPYIGTILLAWGLEPVFLVDNDRAGLTTKRQLVNGLHIDESKVIVYPVETKHSIEDMFSKKDLKELLHRSGVYDPDIPLDDSFAAYNGRFFEKNDARISKRLLALTFNQDPFPLSMKTKSRFRYLFRMIREAFKSSEDFIQTRLF
ncbi:AAA family ATPase [Candidatus Bathyarchaeota archaeon]|nr:AAA family ATPase [Candidatus Bathyarchaeota archaeon]